MLTKEEKQQIHDKAVSAAYDRVGKEVNAITDKKTIVELISAAVTSAIAEYDKLSHPAQ
jgi:hypothetical protein